MKRLGRLDNWSIYRHGDNNNNYNNYRATSSIKKINYIGKQKEHKGQYNSVYTRWCEWEKYNILQYTTWTTAISINFFEIPQMNLQFLICSQVLYSIDYWNQLLPIQSEQLQPILSKQAVAWSADDKQPTYLDCCLKRVPNLQVDV